MTEQSPNFLDCLLVDVRESARVEREALARMIRATESALSILAPVPGGEREPGRAFRDQPVLTPCQERG
jgi:hypothetical protein